MGISNQFGISRASSPGSVSDPRMGTVSSGGPTFLAKLISDISVNAGIGPITVPTITDSNGDRWGFNGSVWTETDAEQPRFYNGALYMEGSHTELSGYSGDIGNWNTVSSASVAQNAVGLKGNSNEAFTVTDNDNASSQRRMRTIAIADDSDTRYRMVRVAYNASPSVYPLFQLSLTDGTPVTESIVFDQSDGTYVEVGNDGSVVSVNRVGGFWFVLLSVDNNSSGNVSEKFSIYPAWNTDGTGTQDATAQGSIIVASAELYKDSPSYAPILTTGGSTKTVNADTEYTIPIGNWPDGDVSVEMEVTPFFDEAPASNEGIFSCRAGSATRGPFFASSAANRVSLFDGTTVDNVDSAWSGVGETIAIKYIANVSSAMKRISAGGNLSSVGLYDESFDPLTNMVIGQDLTRAMAIKNIKIYPVSLGDGWLGS